MKVSKLSNEVHLSVYINNHLCYQVMYSYTSFNGKERLGVCEVQQFKFGADNIYRIHIALISGRANVMYDDLYFDLNLRDEVIYFKGDNPPIYLNTITNMKKKLGGML